MPSLPKPNAKRAKAAKRRAEAKAWTDLRATVFQRDRGRCRACHRPTSYGILSHPMDLGHAHHIRYRSAGGKNMLSNLVLLCAICHALEHAHVIRITGTADDLRIDR